MSSCRFLVDPNCKNPGLSLIWRHCFMRNCAANLTQGPMLQHWDAACNINACQLLHCSCTVMDVCTWSYPPNHMYMYSYGFMHLELSHTCSILVFDIIREHLGIYSLINEVSMPQQILTKSVIIITQTTNLNTHHKPFLIFTMYVGSCPSTTKTSLCVIICSNVT